MPRVKWENGARCAVCLTFDVDGETVWMGREPVAGGPPHPQLDGRLRPQGGDTADTQAPQEIQPARRFLHPELDGGEMAENDRVHREGGA